MPIRIYALAKELNVDSKNLVDTCNKAGITGKGSALASLTDEEVTKVKDFLSGGAASASKPAGVTRRAVAPSVATVSRIESETFTRDDYIAPGGTSIKSDHIETSERTAGAGVPKRAAADDGGETPTRKEPVVRLAALPKSPQPASSPKSDEPVAQKPIMTLPLDAIRGAKLGTRAPLEHLTKQHDKKRKVGGAKQAPAARASSGGGSAPPLGKSSLRDRRHSKTEVPDGAEKGKGLAGMASTRATRQQNRKVRRGPSGRQRRGGDDEFNRPRRRTRLTRKGTNTALPRKGKVVIQLPCTVRSFSEATGVPTTQVQRTLMGLGTMATINSQIELELAELMAAELGLELELKQATSLEETVLAKFLQQEDDPDSLLPRPPVVTFLGHVDHGKTSLLDRIIGTDVVSGEAGGITQHIRAYKVNKGDRKIAFVDTPGHEAFTEMRARGANVTDIAVLVVAADDGVMPQTEEAISHARAADVPIVVALNKMDLPGADPTKVMQDLSANELLPSEWGGDVEVVKTSAMTGDGIDALLETLLLTAELHEYQANPNRPAFGTCLEAQQESSRGVVAKLLVQNGTLRVGDTLVCGTAHGRVKAIYDTLRSHVKIKEAGPSTPVNVTGLDVAPDAGARFYVLDDVGQARELAVQRDVLSRQQSLSNQSAHVSFEEFQQRLADGRLTDDGESATLNLILRADVRGSIEAIRKELGKLEHPEVRIKLLQTSVGGVTLADVHLADASDAVIIGFNVIPEEAARALADERGVEIRRYDIIYTVSDDIKALLEGRLKPEQRVAELGRALVQQVFSISRVGTVAGCRVLGGKIERGCRIRINRDGRGIGDYSLDSLKREKDDTKEVREGFECGIKLAGFNDLKEGDVLEAYKIEEVARTL